MQKSARHAMNQFGFRICNHAPARVLFHHCGRQTSIPSHGTLECPFPDCYDAGEALEQLGDIVLQLAASICARTSHFDFDITATEFGFHLVSRACGAYDVEVMDDDPTRFHLESGDVLMSDGTLVAPRRAPLRPGSSAKGRGRSG